jgi:hypothetical protein
MLVLLEGTRSGGSAGGNGSSSGGSNRAGDAMDSFANALDDQQIADLTNFMRSAWGNHAEPNATPWVVASLRRLVQPPADSPPETLTCPTLEPAVLDPALAAGARSIRAAAHDRAQLAALVAGYRHRRPQGSDAELIDALSAAYCRNTEADASLALRTAEVADYAQQIATVLSEQHGPHRT